MNKPAPGIPCHFQKPLQIIHERLLNSGIDWAITGSLGWVLQGVPLETIHDIDIQTDESGAYRMEAFLSEFICQKTYRRVSERIISHFAVLKIDQIDVEIMGGMQKMQTDGSWEAPVDICLHRHWIDYQQMQLPVLALEYEYQAYNQMGRTEKAQLLLPFL
jgi:hypothetical protein